MASARSLGMRDGRIPCINPNCRRTAPAEKYEPGEEIICRTCFKTLPKSVADRYKALNRRERRLLRLVEKRIAKDSITHARVIALQSAIERRRWENWQAMRAFFRPVDKPQGLDAFLEEVGL